MRFALNAALALMLLSISACKRVETFEGNIEGLDAATKRELVYLNRLKLRTADGKHWHVEFNTTEMPAVLGLAPLRFGELHLAHLATTDHWTITEIVAGDHRLSPSALRIGQHFSASYEPFDIARVNNARVVVLNYAPPAKVLRLSISVDSSTLKDQRSPEAFESIVVSHLAWRLPPDVAIFKPDEIPVSTTVLGDLNVRYKIGAYDSGYAIRTGSIREDIEIDFKPSDARMTTNWTQLKFMGQVRPSGPSLSDYKYESALGQVPLFESRAVAPNE